jgi:hypothetical protein
MASTSGKFEIEKFNGSNFELWKLKMEDLLVDHDLWRLVIGSKPTGMKQEDWDLANRKSNGIIRLYLENSVLLNVHEEKIASSLWKKLAFVYQGKSLVNKLFLRKKLYSLRMQEGGSIADHLNAFSMLLLN